MNPTINNVLSISYLFYVGSYGVIHLDKQSAVTLSVPAICITSMLYLDKLKAHLVSLADLGLLLQDTEVDC